MKRPLAALIVVVASVITGPGAAQGAAPGNDNFSAATPLAVGQELWGVNL